jgi:hypothetical protein
MLDAIEREFEGKSTYQSSYAERIFNSLLFKEVLRVFFFSLAAVTESFKQLEDIADNKAEGDDECKKNLSTQHFLVHLPLL